MIQDIVKYAESIANGSHDEVKPGQDLSFSEACTTNDRIWQGDLSITIIDSVPESFSPASEPQTKLVPGENDTIGSKHVLDSLDGVEMYMPETWNEQSLIGPALKISKTRMIMHPVHGNVTIPAGFCVQIGYQREWDQELARERRAAD